MCSTDTSYLITTDFGLSSSHFFPCRNIGKETRSLAFRLGAEPDEAAEFMIQSAAAKKAEVKYPKIQFVVKDLIDALPPKLRKSVMQKAVPKSKD